jgi:hypothetical protein
MIESDGWAKNSNQYETTVGSPEASSRIRQSLKLSEAF